jgi:tRNA A-37 threonylcarbamoyl transferase component Bud32
MPPDPSSRSASFPSEALSQIDEICVRFEKAWQEGQRPRIEDYLGEITAEHRSALLRELVILDVIYRRKHGEQPTAEDYRERFPGCTDVLPPFPPAEEAPSPAAASVPNVSEPPTTPENRVTSSVDEPPVIPGYILSPAKLGEGGMGIIYLGRDQRLNRDVAVKVLHSRWRGQSHLVRRFIEEAQLTSQLQHPVIPPIHELGELPGGRPYFSMKVVKGRTLADLLKERPRLRHDLPHFLEVFEQVCQAVAYAHSKRVIHRDLKPSNVMVGAFGEVQVMDWGLAKVLPEQATAAPEAEQESGSPVSVVETVRSSDNDSATVPGAVLGTYAYMPPEQARGEVAHLDKRCDVFGLGAILCEILTGKPPYEGTREEVKARAQLGDLAPTLERLDACGVEEDLIQIARSCLHKVPEERPAHAGMVAEAVALYQAGEQDRLRAAEVERAAAAAREEEARATAAARAREEEAKATAAAERRARRLAVGLVAALVVGILATGYFLREARHQAKEASEQKDRAEEARDLAEAEKKRAEEEKHRADEARKEAVMFRDRVEWLNYANQLALAQREWEANNARGAWHYLESTRHDFRAWEYRHLSTLFKSNQRTFQPQPTAPVLSVRFSPDGKRLASASGDRTVKVWDAVNGGEVLTLKGHTHFINSICFNPDGNRLASASHDRTVRLWDADTGQELPALKGHTGAVSSVCFSPDGNRLASASHDRTVRLWNAVRGQEVLILKGHTDIIDSVCFSPDDRRLATASRDGTVKVWDAQKE